MFRFVECEIGNLLDFPEISREIRINFVTPNPSAKYRKTGKFNCPWEQNA